MALADLVVAYYAAQTALVQAAAQLSAVLWDAVDLLRPTSSWRAQRTGERLFVAVSTGQLAAAQRATPLVTRAVAEQDAVPALVATLEPRRLSGVASDGRNLEMLLLQPLIQTEAAISEGLSPEQAHALGGSALDTIVRTQVADAGREAEAVAIVAEPAVTGWVRMLTPPSCGRCAILAGRHYKWNDGFRRHPRCDCVHIPAVEDRADDLRTDPKLYFESLSEADQNKHFGAGQAEAIRQGTDIHKAVNVGQRKAGLSRPGKTRAGRLMPADIIAAAGGDRDETVRLLRRYGYLK